MYMLFETWVGRAALDPIAGEKGMPSTYACGLTSYPVTDQGNATWSRHSTVMLVTLPLDFRSTATVLQPDILEVAFMCCQVLHERIGITD